MDGWGGGRGEGRREWGREREGGGRGDKVVSGRIEMLLNCQIILKISKVLSSPLIFSQIP